MNRFKDTLRRFMAGRYGMDSLGRCCLAVSLLLILLSGLLIKIPILYSITNTVGLLLLLYSYFRMFSRNISRRYAENCRFVKLTSGISRAAGDKTHRYFRCPQCRQTIRVPRGKGRIEITCPKCSKKFIKKT